MLEATWQPCEALSAFVNRHPRKEPDQNCQPQQRARLEDSQVPRNGVGGSGESATRTGHQGVSFLRIRVRAGRNRRDHLRLGSHSQIGKLRPVAGEPGPGIPDSPCLLAFLQDTQTTTRHLSKSWFHISDLKVSCYFSPLLHTSPGNQVRIASNSLSRIVFQCLLL